MLIDSNIIIYSALPENEWLRDFVREHAPSVSAISYVEVLGYHKLTEQDHAYFVEFFDASMVLPITDDVVEQAARLRRARKISVGDALVAASALVHSLILVTRNVDDFEWIKYLRLLNPFVANTEVT